MPNYKLLALDLDGTTLTDDKRITDETKKWIRQATNEGVTVIFATGRGIQTTIDYWKELALESPMVLVNGAEIWKGPEQVWERYFLNQDDLRWLHDKAEQAGVHYWGYSVESFTNKHSWTTEMFERKWLKFGMSDTNEAKITEIRELLQKRGTLEITCSAPTNIEISVKGISKETGVRRVCELLNITMDQVMAIGDNLNDERLIRAAGLGVAMGNGDESLKKAADVVTGTNEDNGVAKAIERYLLGTYVKS
ncbi:HAD family hydrolase [Bacillus niameyensis]|uniref:HAD family hydrolase n=1 Tax=Bacillus niameyensis TaxID=1522308 RepID=UPI0007815412|nr:Cof-type HAD-IIB family hydrolase [Bacillus niameyensis]